MGRRHQGLRHRLLQDLVLKRAQCITLLLPPDGATIPP